MTERTRVGLIVNPLAGIGGRVGLKGSDGVGTVKRALELGATPYSPVRAAEALTTLAAYRDELTFMTYPGEMGQDVAVGCGLRPTVLGSITNGETTSEDTRRAAREMAEAEAALILFVGGDGTARDMCAAVGARLPVLGIPAGVKMHSSVYIVNPRQLSRVMMDFLRGQAPTREMEVMDIDEEMFRAGHVSARLFGYLMVPYERNLIQAAKVANRGTAATAQAIAESVVDAMDDEHFYILGPGTTVKAVADELGIQKTLLGVDVVRGRKLVCADVGEGALLELLSTGRAKIVVTAIGGQGYIFGRGNQQISAKVIRTVGKENVIVIATLDKLTGLEGPLRVDTGDEALDEELSGFMRVTTGYQTETVWKVTA